MDSSLRCCCRRPLQPSGGVATATRTSRSSAASPLLPLRRSGARRSVSMSMSTGDASAKPSSPRRFAVLKTGHASDYTERTHGGYGQMLARLVSSEHDPTEQSVSRLLSDGGDETWDIFSVVDGDFSFLDGGYYDGYVLTGSAADAHATDVDWINRLSDALVLLHRRRNKLLGICFGHQILARALGGRTGRAEVGWELGVKTLLIDSDQVSQLYGLALPSALNAIESHQDQVSIVPPGAVVLASSVKTQIEMFAIGDHVLAMQCHPEFSEDVMIDIIRTRLSRKVVEDGVAKEAIESFEKRQPDNDLLQALCKAFLKGRCA